MAGFDRLIEYTLNDIDNDFKRANEQIFREKKGLGLWLWKPYLINKALRKLETGDILFYCDSSSVFIGSIRPFIKFMETQKLDFLPFSSPFKESHWTSEGVMEWFGLNRQQRESNQLSASFLALKKTRFTKEIISDWLGCCQQYQLLSGKTLKPESPRLIEHRYDQSLLSMIVKKRGLTNYKDPSQYGRFPQLCGKNHEIFLNEPTKGDYGMFIVLTRRGSFLRSCLDVIYHIFLFKIVATFKRIFCR